jgi:hypothetical protein
MFPRLDSAIVFRSVARGVRLVIEMTGRLAQLVVLVSLAVQVGCAPKIQPDLRPANSTPKKSVIVCNSVAVGFQVPTGWHANADGPCSITIESDKAEYLAEEYRTQSPYDYQGAPITISLEASSLSAVAIAEDMRDEEGNWQLLSHEGSGYINGHPYLRGCSPDKVFPREGWKWPNEEKGEVHGWQYSCMERTVIELAPNLSVIIHYYPPLEGFEPEFPVDALLSSIEVVKR